MKAPDPLILGLCGLAGTGKDTAAAYLCAAHGFERYAFAEPMRDMLEALFEPAGLDHAYIHEPQLKDQPVPGLGLGQGISYRQLAQTLGTEWARQQLHPDFWLRIAELRLGLPSAPVHDRIVITDVRLPSEAEWVNGYGGAVVTLERPAAAPVRPHVTEQQAEQIKPWCLVDNSSDRQWLHWQLDAIVERLVTGER
jgi:hypothetical protein